MTLRFAYECYADEDVVLFLRDHCRLPPRTRHSFGQGEVVNDLLKKDQAAIGMVDEDPGSSHHPLRDQMEVIHRTEDLEIRRKSGRHLIILKPELEDCFLRAAKRIGLVTRLPANPKEMQKVLNLPNHPSHQIFRDELGELHKRATAKKISTFITDLESLVRTLV